MYSFPPTMTRPVGRAAIALDEPARRPTLASIGRHLYLIRCRHQELRRIDGRTAALRPIRRDAPPPCGVCSVARVGGRVSFVVETRACRVADWSRTRPASEDVARPSPGTVRVGHPGIASRRAIAPPEVAHRFDREARANGWEERATVGPWAGDLSSTVEKQL